MVLVLAATCWALPHAVLPSSGAKDVPRNAQILVFGARPNATYELRAAGYTGARATPSVDDFGTARLSPGELPASTSVVVLEDGVQLTQFTTGDTDDTTPPSETAEATALQVDFEDRTTGVKLSGWTPPAGLPAVDCAAHPRTHEYARARALLTSRPTSTPAISR